MAEHPMTNQGSSLVWQMGGVTLSYFIVSSYVIWQAATHLEVIIDDIRYCATGGNFDHRSLRLQLNIDCTFVE